MGSGINSNEYCKEFSSEWDRSEISEWYRNKTVFVTGGTGFLGKVLVEKLLRTCNVKRIYLLVRPKQGVDIRKRINDMTKLKIFENIRREQPEMLQKIVPVGGDIAIDGLGISEKDELRIIEEVDVVFHSAATLNFHEPMKVAMNLNMLGTKRIVDLAHKMSNIKALVYVSTAYSNCHLSEINEKLYPAPVDPSHLIQLTERFDDEIIKHITPKLIAPRPNTYTYTKALAEHVIVKESGTIPYAIVRPSIVTGAWREPMPGWVDNLMAYNGYVMGMGTGMMRVSFLKSGIKLDLIPVDLVTNTLIASAWNTNVQQFRTNGDNIYNCSSSSQNPITSNDIQEYSKHVIRKYPFNSVLWYPSITSMKFTKLAHRFPILFSNIIPAYLTDGILKVSGRKSFAVKECKQLFKNINSTKGFATRSWTIHNRNVRNLYDALCPVDKKLFNFDISQLDWKEYYKTYHLGINQYVLKEPLNCTTRDGSRLKLFGGLKNSRVGAGIPLKHGTRSLTPIEIQRRRPLLGENSLKLNFLIENVYKTLLKAFRRI